MFSILGWEVVGIEGTSSTRLHCEGQKQHGHQKLQN